jgi:thiol-disulfide isomerase/thioredoxin
MFKSFFLFCIMAFLFAACNNGNFSIKGTIKDMPVQKFYLEQLGASIISSLDSGTTSENGTFKICGNAIEPSMYRIRFAKGKFILFVLKNETVTVTADWNNLEEYRLEGSPGSQSLSAFLGALRQHLLDLKSFDKITNAISKKNGNKDSMMAELSSQINKVNDDYTDYVKQFADTTSLVPNATFAANFLNYKVEGAYVKNFYDKLQKRFPNSDLAKEFTTIYGAKLGNVSAPSEPQYVKKPNGKYDVIPTDAKPATDFSAKTPDGQTIALSSFKGKYVLIDFWASWCAPCRAENPNVLAAFRQYKDKNFDILSVSLDDDKNEWRIAIENDGLVWTHVSELTRWGSVIARQYGITNIPANVLVNPDGIIIAKNLKGPALEEKLANVLK